jgi:endonuclease I
LQEALHGIIDDHTAVTYTDLWVRFEQTDRTPDGKVWDMYSDIPGSSPPYLFEFFSDQCGNYSSEGDCYNREHSFPKSWFGGENYPMYTDLFHIYPTDGYVNNKRANYPYGDVGSASWTSLNGSKLGGCIDPGYSGTAFEPVDGYKGDLARGLLYMAVRYYGEDAGWPGSEMFDGSQPTDWALELLREWHVSDPVSTKEIDRNNVVYGIQENRNPFIDHPEYVGLIWFNPGLEASPGLPELSVSAYPNPVRNRLYIRIQETGDATNILLTGITITGCQIELSFTEEAKDLLVVNTDCLDRGMYFLHLTDSSTGKTTTLKILK